MDISKEMELFKNTAVCDWHEHVGALGGTNELDAEKCDRLAENAAMLYIDKIAVSNPTSRIETPERISALNDTVAQGVKRHPKLLYGMCFAEPHHGGRAADEIERCVKGLGFVGVKLYTQRAIDDPMQYVIIEKCVELDVPILMHSMKFGPRYPGPEPFASHGSHFKRIAEKYPEAVFIIGHIGNGDWHWQLKGLKKYENVFADISGSAYDAGVVEAVVGELGADRVLFASDGSFSASVGKLLGAEISLSDKQTILNGARFKKYMDRRDGR